MQNTPATIEHPIVNIEESAMPLANLTEQVNLIQQIMKKIMHENEHYGIIPGTDKPTLLKPGAEKLCLTFRLGPDYEIIREVREKDFIAYTVRCSLTHIPTGRPIASGVGSCNSRETKYRYRSENTGRPVPKEYWDKRDPDILGGTQFKPRKKKDENGKNRWFIFEQIENDNPWDLDNTLVKMACKRSLIAATLNATAASDIFTQDIEDMPVDIINAEVAEAPPESQNDQLKPRGRGRPPKKQEEQSNGIVPQLNKFLAANRAKYFEIMGMHGFSSIEDILNANKDQQDNLLIDLKKSIVIKE